MGRPPPAVRPGRLTLGSTAWPCSARPLYGLSCFFKKKLLGWASPLDRRLGFKASSRLSHRPAVPNPATPSPLFFLFFLKRALDLQPGDLSLVQLMKLSCDALLLPALQSSLVFSIAFFLFFKKHSLPGLASPQLAGL